MKEETAGRPKKDAKAKPSQPEAGYQKSILRDYAETILICVIFVIFSRGFVFQQSKIPSVSMKDTLLKGDYIMVNRFVYAPHSFRLENLLLPMRPIRHGDVVVFKQPNEPETDFIKRVIGLPGDIVELRQGDLYINSDKVPEPYINEEYRLQDRRRTFGPIEVRPGHYFVMGDHRNMSSDSRFWGQVPRELMKGRALMIWWSFPEDGPVYPKLGERLKAWGKKLAQIHRSRWDRCFKLIR